MAGRYASDEDLSEVADAMREGEETGQAPEDPEPDEEGEGTSEGEEVGEEPAAEGEAKEQDSEEGEAEAAYTVNLDGKDVEVPVSELIRGYLRTQDYTRKTQLLGNQRRQLEDANELMLALERNPQATLRVLAGYYKVSEYEPDEDTGPSPEQVRLHELEQWRQAELARQREAAVDMELDRLHREYGNFDEDALFTFAVERGVQDLETALRAMTFGGQVAKRRTEKRAVAAVSGGGSRNGAVHPKAPVEKIESFMDAYEFAKRERELGN